MTKVLDGVRILDFSRYLAGPFCGLLLADMGADVIRVERPGGEEDRRMGPFVPPTNESLFVMVAARNKRAITLDIRKEKGQQILVDLVKEADVVLHNFTSGSNEASILSYECLKEMNPSIIVTAVSGFDVDGPYSQDPAFDFIAQALTGIMSYSGFPGSPPLRATMPYVDYSTGLHAALGTMLALYHKQATGEGQKVNIALLDVATTFMAPTIADYVVLGHTRQQLGNASYYNFSDCFRTKDGWVMLATISNPIWKRFSRAIGREDLKEDPRFHDDMSRFENRQVLLSIVQEWLNERTTQEVLDLMQKARVPCAQINSIEEMMTDPKVTSTNMMVNLEYPEIGAVPVAGTAIKLSKTPGGVARRAPKVGEQNEEIYSELLGLDSQAVAELEKDGIL